jgi:two-component system chemotaxis response regulator CheY
MSQVRLRPENEITIARFAAVTPRILVVEPDDDTRSMYCEWFHPWGCDVIEASDGREALAKALVRRPALVITEIRLPFVDGYALCEILRRDHVTTHVPILVVTGEGRAGEVKRAKSAGASVVLVKPITRDQMLDETRRLVVDGTAGRELATANGSELESQPPTHGRRMSKSLARVATCTPPLTPPPAVCPLCDRLLTYRHSHLGGVSERHREQWDWYVCPTSCGTFEYRHRTRRLRRLVEDEALR